MNWLNQALKKNLPQKRPLSRSIQQTFQISCDSLLVYKRQLGSTVLEWEIGFPLSTVQGFVCRSRRRKGQAHSAPLYPDWRRRPFSYEKNLILLCTYAPGKYPSSFSIHRLMPGGWQAISPVFPTYTWEGPNSAPWMEDYVSDFWLTILDRRNWNSPRWTLLALIYFHAEVGDFYSMIAWPSKRRGRRKRATFWPPFPQEIEFRSRPKSKKSNRKYTWRPQKVSSWSMDVCQVGGGQSSIGYFPLRMSISSATEMGPNPTRTPRRVPALSTSTSCAYVLYSMYWILFISPVECCILVFVKTAGLAVGGEFFQTDRKKDPWSAGHDY